MGKTKQLHPKNDNRTNLSDKPKPKLSIRNQLRTTEWGTSLYQGQFQKQLTILGHTEKHTNQSDIKLMDRLLSQDISASSAFIPEELSEDDIKENEERIEQGLDPLTPMGGEDYIKAVLSQDMDRIVTWSEFATKGEEGEIRRAFRNTTSIGRGFAYDQKTNLIREYTTNGLTLSLGFQYDDPRGITLKTAYPDLNIREPRAGLNITPTNRDLTPIIQATPTYKCAGSIKRAYLDYVGNPQSKLAATYSEKKNSIYLNTSPKNDPSVTHTILLGKGASLVQTTRTMQNGREKPIDTELTELRDRLHPHDRGRPYVSLRDPRLAATFFKMCPQSKTTVDNLVASINDHYSNDFQWQPPEPITSQPDATPTTDATKSDTHNDRVARAVALSDNIQPTTRGPDHSYTP